MKLSCAKTVLVRHQECGSYKDAVRRSASLNDMNRTISSLFGPIDEAAGTAEVKIASFLVEKNLPINISDNLLAWIKSLCPSNTVSRKLPWEKSKQLTLFAKYLVSIT